MPTENNSDTNSDTNFDEIISDISKNISKAVVIKKTLNSYVETCNKSFAHREDIMGFNFGSDDPNTLSASEFKSKTEMLGKASERPILFTENDIIVELNFCTELFLLHKTGDTIACDCGSRKVVLDFVGKKVVSKDTGTVPSEKDINYEIENHKEGVFGTCLLEDPSRHPGTNAVGGNACKPYIVGTSWLDTYNNAKAEGLNLVLKKKSWLACKYMGRIMSSDDITNNDISGMDEEKALGIMMEFAKW